MVYTKIVKQGQWDNQITLPCRTKKLVPKYERYGRYTQLEMKIEHSPPGSDHMEQI